MIFKMINQPVLEAFTNFMVFNKHIFGMLFHYTIIDI